jgi:hypothetical protein
VATDIGAECPLRNIEVHPMPEISPELKAIFCEALDYPSGAERQAYLERACAGDHALRARVSEWASNNLYADRIFKIRNGITLGSYTFGLNLKMVRSNGKSSTVADGPKQSKYQNWFIVNSKDSVTQRDEEVMFINT